MLKFSPELELRFSLLKSADIVLFPMALEENMIDQFSPRSQLYERGQFL